MLSCYPERWIFSEIRLEEVADTKYTADLRPLFKLGKAVAQKQPKTLITDGAPNFHEAYTKEFYTLKNGTEHIREIRLAGKIHNNRMERMNGEIRDRERVMRTLEKPDTPILKGMEIYHNFIHPHMALKGKTPAEAAGRIPMLVRTHTKNAPFIRDLSTSLRQLRRLV